MGKKGGKTKARLREIKISVRVAIVRDNSLWGSFKVLEAYPEESRQAIERAVFRATQCLHKELEKEYAALFKRETGHNPKPWNFYQ